MSIRNKATNAICEKKSTNIGLNSAFEVVSRGTVLLNLLITKFSYYEYQ